MNCARGGTSISAAFSTAWQKAVAWENAESPDTLSARNTPRCAGSCLEELLRPFVRVEHAELQVEDGLARDGEIEVAGFDDAGVHRPHGNLEDAFPQRRPVDVLFALEGGQHRVERKILAQRVHIRPVVVQRHAPRIRVAFGFDPEPVLNLALLPVHGRQIGGQRREPRILGWDAAPAGSR